MNVYIFEESNTGKVSQPFTSLRRLQDALRDANVCGSIYCMTAKSHKAVMGEGWDMPTFKALADSVTPFPFE